MHLTFSHAPAMKPTGKKRKIAQSNESVVISGKMQCLKNITLSYCTHCYKNNSKTTNSNDIRVEYVKRPVTHLSRTSRRPGMDGEFLQWFLFYSQFYCRRSKSRPTSSLERIFLCCQVQLLRDRGKISFTFNCSINNHLHRTDSTASA